MAERTALIAARTAIGLRQDELAARVDISGSYLSYIENGRKTPNAKIMGRLATELGRPATELFPDELAPELDKTG